jgi:RNA polymerase sigma-70 factor, ECF subfamily
MDSVLSARSGDEAAFLQLFDDHHQPLYRFAYRMTGSAADAEDIVQECFLELLRPGCSYDSARTPLRTYLFGVVRNQSVKRIQRNAREMDQSIEPTAAHSPALSPESLALHAELKDMVAGAVMQLPETQRDVLILAHYEQMPLAEIARLLELEPAAVKSRLQRGRARLKEILAAYAPGLEQRS